MSDPVWDEFETKDTASIFDNKTIYLKEAKKVLDQQNQQVMINIGEA